MPSPFIDSSARSVVTILAVLAMLAGCREKHEPIKPTVAGAGLTASTQAR